VEELRAAIARHLRVPTESVILTQGADQGIDMLCRVFLGQSDCAIIASPTYSFYKLRVAVAGVKCTEISIKQDLTLPVDEILSQAKSASLIFVCSPNNPTGNQFSTQEIIEICQGFSGLVVLDEAYVEYAEGSLVNEVIRRRNLAVLRTFSKAFGLANLRLGYIIGNPAWAQLLQDRIQYPYPISSIVAAVAMQLLEEFELVEKAVKSVKKERALLLESLRMIEGVKVFDSQANFILASLPVTAENARAELLKRGIAIKKIGRVLDLPNCIRVTVGTRDMNSNFLNSLNEVLSDA
jgi:histidinol-phosphate aminotransferase